MSRQRGYKHTPETIEKIRLASARYWADRPSGTVRAVKRSPEVAEKISRTLKQRWQEPEFRARHLPHLLSIQSAGGKVCAAKRSAGIPAIGTEQRRTYRKVRSILGPDAARSLQW
jgi:hypothetical protein